MYPCRPCWLCSPFPLYTAFPCSEYYGRSAIRVGFCGAQDGPFAFAYSFSETHPDFPGSVTSPLPSVPCAKTPPAAGEPRPIGSHPDAFRVFDRVGLRFLVYEAEPLY